MMNILDNFRSYLNQNRTVYRAGWLRYIPFNEMVPSDEHRFWVVFSITSPASPFLEFYRRRQNIAMFNEGPVSKHSLASCQSVVAINHENILHNNNNNHHKNDDSCEGDEAYEAYELNVCMANQTIRLAADSRESMLDWIYSLQTKLHELRILPQNPEYSAEEQKPELPPRRTRSKSSSPQNVLLHKNINNNYDNDKEDENFDDDEAPPPYEINHSPQLTSSPLPESSSSSSSALSFREQQVETLRQQISNRDGILLKVRRKDFLKGVAVVDIDALGVFISGWRQREFPNLHDIFHIGDRILSVNSQTFQSSDDLRTSLKQLPAPKLEILVQRLPFGRIFCLKRSFAGQDSGLVLNDGTGEIVQIKNGSIAETAGLSYTSGLEDSNWYLTEINNRPLNLFFNDGESEKRLNAIGKEISILVQPSAFVRKLRKQLKNHVKNYKDYLVQ